MIGTLSEIGLEVTDLPGVRLRLRAIREDLDAGRSCLWLLPSKTLEGPAPEAEVLLEYLLHDLRNFAVLPGPQAAELSQVPVPVEEAVRHPTGTPLLDFDDGLSDFFDVPELIQLEETTRRPTVAEALDELFERLAKEVLPHISRSSAAEPSMKVRSSADEVLAQLMDETSKSPRSGVLVIKGWEEPSAEAPARLLQRLAASVKSHGMHEAVPRALVACSSDGVPRRLLDDLPRQGVAVHWWWGVTGRLDTSTVVAMARAAPARSSSRGRLLESVLQATVSEVAGPHLTVAAELAREWDGSPEALYQAVRRLLGRLDGVPPTVQRLVARHPGERPRRELLQMWNSREVDSWDGHLRLHLSRGASRDDLDKQMWLAQNRVLLPVIDSARERFLSVFADRAAMPPEKLVAKYSSSVASGGECSLSALELGPMWAAVQARDVLLRREEREALFRLRRARNLLAHRKPLTGSAFEETIAVVCE